MNKAATFGWLAMFALLGATTQLPSYRTVAGATTVAVDTVTYGDERIVYTLDMDTVTTGGQLRYIVDLAAAPAGARYKLILKTDFDSVMLITGDTFALSPTDSATALARATAWGVNDPQGITLAWHTPAAQSPLDGLGIDATDSTRLAQLIGFPYVSFPATTADIPQLAEVDSLFEYWSDLKWPDFVDSIAILDRVYAHYYYSRALSHYSYWWRTGDTKWLQRADSLQRAWVDVFQRPPCQDQAYRQFSTSHWIYYAVHSDSTEMRDCGAEQADINWVRFRDDFDPGIYDDVRTQGRTAEGIMYLGLYYPLYVGAGSGATNWDTIANPGMLDSLIAFHDAHTAVDGYFRTTSYCGGAAAFQVAHGWIVPAYRFRDLYGTYRASRVDSIATAALDTMIAHFNFDEMRDGVNIYGIDYVIGKTGGSCNVAAEAGLNMLIAPAFMMVYDATGTAKYKDYADSLVKYAIEWNDDGWSFNFGKEYNQSFYQFWWAAAKMAD